MLLARKAFGSELWPGQLVEFGVSRAGLGHDYRRSYNHSDERKGNEQIMHFEGPLLWGS
jgi:hypothetical protein